MGERSDELTESRETDGPSTEDLLAETDRLISGSEADGGSAGRVDQTDRSARRSDSAADETSDESGSWWPFSRGDETDADHTAEPDSGRLARLRPNRSAREYFSPKAFLAVLVLAGTGLFVGSAVLPLGGLGRIVGLLAVTFLLGLLTSKRRYLETSVAGASAGAISMVFFSLPLLIVGSGRTGLAVGAALGLVVSVFGYYFGRDLRNGLVRDIE
ncbi:DUF456 domain-containing protein [Natrarchaeobius chitinivorans]|uniref:DUF456 domain-containing protein n=1 Tax=Natrarchaeobius chitinivorans TaxID=1679083 RepID=A0A3N6LRA9_NATCH|nr:DUF456 domain-containing protein [Natrarchaeobius chitinivorans]RQG92243.1 DUF456 domain-containing protein [Natrarchaeobius chitinivorans]